VLIEEVVLSPRMQHWQIATFLNLLERLKFDRPARASSLLTSPFWVFKKVDLTRRAQ